MFLAILMATAHPCCVSTDFIDSISVDLLHPGVHLRADQLSGSQLALCDIGEHAINSCCVALYLSLCGW